MIAEIGHFALALGLATALAQTLCGLGVAGRSGTAIAGSAACVQFFLIALSFAALSYLFVVSDFSVRVVAENSHSTKPLLYRLSGVWGNHEGSMLLWSLMLAVFSGLVASRNRTLDSSLKSRVIGFLGLISVSFLAFILFTSDPFARLNPAPLDGLDLNPVLQDPALAFHPPVLYFGYVGFSVAFAFAMAGLVTNRIDAAWARAVRPWVLLAWLALTLGIAFGSYWAYYELGWGGYWFWDPVENASLLPWLAGTALLHSVIVVERREALKAWTVLLAIIAFAMSLIGTFLVRSGVLTSVHAFASNPERGIFILAIVVGLIGAALALFAWRAPKLTSGGGFEPTSREGLIVFNNLLVSTLVATILLGTLYPIAIEALSGDLVSVGAPYFNLVCGLLAVPLFAAMPFGPLAPWKQARLGAVSVRLLAAAAAGIVALIVALAVLGWLGNVAFAFGIAGAVWILAGALTELLTRIGVGQSPAREWAARTRGLSRGGAASFFGHAGIGIALLGICLSGALKLGATQSLHPGESMTFGSTTVTLQSIGEKNSASYTATAARFNVEHAGTERMIESERRHYWVRDITTTEVGLGRYGASMVYLVLGDARQIAGGTAWTIRAFYQPQILLIWLGALSVAFGGALSLLGRWVSRDRVPIPADLRLADQPAE